MPRVSTLLLTAFTAVALLLGAEASVAGEASPAPATEASAPVGHPLRGTVVAVLADKSALLVKHEEISGVMAAMTMLLKVDAATLADARKDQPITGTLLRKPDGWWLENVRPAETAAPHS